MSDVVALVILTAGSIAVAGLLAITGVAIYAAVTIVRHSHPNN